VCLTHLTHLDGSGRRSTNSFAPPHSQIAGSTSKDFKKIIGLD